MRADCLTDDPDHVMMKGNVSLYLVEDAADLFSGVDDVDSDCSVTVEEGGESGPRSVAGG